MAMKKLSRDTVQLVSSSQVITSAHSVVKELVENALDAKTSSIDVRLENFGLDLIQVRDNGTGIRITETPFMATPHYTSKLSSFQELSSLTSYGFRGEALSSIASVADLSITTATKDDELAHTYTIDHRGQVIATKPSSLGVGTTVAVANLFENFPVRRKVYKNTKRCHEDLKRIEQVLLAFGLAFPDVRFSLKHNKSKLWDKEQSANLKSNVSLIFGPVLSQQLLPVNYQCFNPMVKLQVYVPKPSADLSLVTRSRPDRLFILVNSRPVESKEIAKIVREAFTEAFPSQAGRFPVAVVMISVLSEDVDVNLEPNKTRVLLHRMDFISNTLSSLLSQAYGPCRVATRGSSRPEGTHAQKQDHPHRQESDSNDPPQRDVHTPDTDPPERQCENNSSAPHMLERDPPLTTSIPPTQSTSVTTSSTSDQEQHSLCESLPRVVDTLPAQSPLSSIDDVSKGVDLDTDYSLLEISELEKDFVSSGEEEVTVEETEEPTITTNKDGLSSPGTVPGTDQVASSGQVSLLSWSRGEAITDTAKNPVEPVKVLNTPAPDTEQPKTAMQSKLSVRKPAIVFDLVHSQPVKRAAGNSSDGHRPAAKRKKDLLSTSLDQFLSVGVDKALSMEVCFELDKIAKRNKTRWKRELIPQSSDHVVGSCQSPEGEVWIVSLKGTLARFNTDRLPGALPLLTLTRDAVEEQFRNTLECASSVDMLTKTPLFQGIHTMDRQS